MNKVYEHQKYEKDIYKLWEKSGSFTPTINKNKKPFTIIMPPPNANDPLHIGHAREVTTQDILIRYHRMKGKPTLWLPGSDHAGIETQFVFEKKLAKVGKSRFDFDQKTLYKMIWADVMKNITTMHSQLRILGATCDWSRHKFTLDPDIIKVVYKTFKKLHDDGLVYRGDRIVNYCPHCGTSYSQLEIDTIEKEDSLYFIDYGNLTIATTRPETIFADVAVAVNPLDKRYKKLVGSFAKIPLINREVPIIADVLVDKDFGTGALKITPGHDMVDFDIGQRHELPSINVIDDSGKMIGTPEKYIGMKIDKARQEAIKDLQAIGKIKKIIKIKHLVGVCYKHKTPIEPRPQSQWFVKIKPLVKPALSAINNGEVKFTAKKFEKIAKHWYKNLYDWNISRQIIWGIRIPAWRCEKCHKWTITEGTTPTKCSYCKNGILTQDPDTFDTWFSSGQWPYATLKTTKPGDFDYFYPTSVMDPAYDILPFWVIRMIMLGIYSTGGVPFREVLLHGLVRDKHGVKIGKSKGNVIDPIEMVDKYGADALRMASVWGSLVENDNALSEENVRGQRNFANKIWNIARFVLTNRDNSKLKTKDSKLNTDDKWILDELKTTSKKTTEALNGYRINEAAEEIYDFIWHKFADIYIEKTKNHRESSQQTLELILVNVLILLHPFMPFVTETIWQEGRKISPKVFGSSNLITSRWPKA